ncbi:MAG: hypothetical protein MK212_09060, partial [Saprospiraceae bacterium]|nr:hypothetical protein [Saprospiraceae bacterium]
GEGVYDQNAPKTGVQKQLDDLINDEDPGKFLGIGADDDDEYKSQRDNEAVYLSNSKSSTFGNRIVGDIQCNVTSLSMMLIAMNSGDEDGVIEIVKEAIKKSGGTYKSSWGIEELLAKYTDLQGSSVFSSSTMGKMAKKLMSTKLSKVETIWEQQIKSDGLLNVVKDKILPALKEGAEVILSGKFTHGGHIVFLRSLKSDGPVINDPYGACLGIGQYMKNGDAASKNKSKFNSYNEVLKRRLSINGLYDKVEKAIKENGTLPANMGQDNLYSWDDFAAINPYRFIITHKK